MGRNGGTTVVGGGGSSGGGGGSADYAAEAGHALEADHATTADSATTAATADEATHAASADNAAVADMATEAANLTSDSTDWQKIANKTIAQTIAEVWTFAKGIVSTLKSYFNAGIEVTGGVTTDTVNASGNVSSGGMLSGAGLSITNDGRILGDLSVGGELAAAKLIADVIKTIGFKEAVNMIGRGFGVKVDANDIATVQTDNLLVLGRMIVNALNIREVSYIGGSYQLTSAASQAVKVQPLYTTISFKPDTRYWTPNGSGDVVGYRLLWLADNGSVGTMNYWKQGDTALCQTFNVTQPGSYTTAANQYYKRCVCRVGQVTMVDNGITKKYHYADLAAIETVYLFDANNEAIYTVDGSSAFDGYMTGSTVPADGDKVVQYGSQADANRQGCVYITAEGEASIGIYDGIKDFRDLSNYEIHYLSKTAVRMNAAYFSWRSNGTTKTQASVLIDLSTAQSDIDALDESMTEVVDEVAEITLNVGNIQLGVGKMTITKHNGITANYDFWEQSGEHTIRNSSWESGYWTSQGNASPSSYRIRSAASVYGFSNANGFLLYDMNGGSNLEFFEIDNNGTGTPQTYALRYTPPTEFAVPETYSVKAHILSYVDDGNGNWVFDQHAQETDANSGVVYITPSKGTVRFRIYFVATGKMIGNDPVDAITNLQPYLATANVSNSLIQMVSDQLKVMVNQCGLDIKQRIIDIIADKVNFKMPDGSTNVKISIDPATGSLNAVDGNFSGTVKANNLYHGVCVWGQQGTLYYISASALDTTVTNSIADYDDQNDTHYADNFSVGDMVTYDEFRDRVNDEYGPGDATGVIQCTGYADIVLMPWNPNSSADRSVYIPPADDAVMQGKIIEVRDTVNGGYHPTNIVVNIAGRLASQSGGSFCYGVKENGDPMQEGSESYCTLQGGASSRFYSIYLDSRWYWLALGENITIPQT